MFSVLQNSWKPRKHRRRRGCGAVAGEYRGGVRVPGGLLGDPHRRFGVGGGLSAELIDGRGRLIFGGVVSVLYGALLIVTPMIGAVVLTWWLGAYALVFGVSLVVLAFKLHARLEKH